jgi:ABC-2 type transport system ATP-binding protein
MVHAEEICDHIVMLHRGRKVLDESLASIRRRHDPRTLVFEPFDRDADIGPLRGLDGVSAVTRDAGAYRVEMRDGADPAAVMSRVAQAIPSARLELHRQSLEDVFIGLVQ